MRSYNIARGAPRFPHSGGTSRVPVVPPPVIPVPTTEDCDHIVEYIRMKAPDGETTEGGGGGGKKSRKRKGGGGGFAASTRLRVEVEENRRKGARNVGNAEADGKDAPSDNVDAEHSEEKRKETGRKKGGGGGSNYSRRRQGRKRS